jgi:hypothetical protein
MAVLDCGHEVPYNDVKWPEGLAECPVKAHDSDGKALPPAPAAAPGETADDTGPVLKQ